MHDSIKSMGWGCRTTEGDIMQDLIKPTLRDLLDKFSTEIFTNLNCMLVGKINSFDKTKKTAEIQIMIKHLTSSGVSAYPVLVDCPVFTLQGGGAQLKMPIAAGDSCLVFFCDHNIDAWFASGASVLANDSRAHDLSDGFAFVGVDSLASVATAYDVNVNLVVPSGSKFIVSGSGTGAEIFGTAALALLSELKAWTDWAKTHTHPDPQGGTTGAPVQTPPTDPVGTTKLKAS